MVSFGAEQAVLDLDVVIFGGGSAGLWLLDELRRRGSNVALLEANALCAGQTIAAQGIIHGGLKYSLQGLLTKSAANIREMPDVWRDCLSGQREPNLNQVRRRSDSCYLWRTDSWSSRLGMLGAQLGLRVAPQSVSKESRPEVLQGCPGSVAELPEQVISPESFAQVLSKRNASRLLKIERDQCHLDCVSSGQVNAIHLSDRDASRKLTMRPKSVVFTAGAGNETLRRAVGLPDSVMQRRPLHMVMLRGPLPMFQGHCVDGAKTRVTITSDRDLAGRIVWQVGGQIAEDGVACRELDLLSRTRSELLDVLPGLDLRECEWSTYRVDRAEGRVSSGRRPETVQILQDGNCLTAWPTKLALVPQLVAELCELIAPCNPKREREDVLQKSWPTEFEQQIEQLDWPRPTVALPPWEVATRWWTTSQITTESATARAA